MATWWLSFVDTSREVGDQFVGACVIGGADARGAVLNAGVFGCNPGGEVAVVQFPEAVAPLVDARWRKRLLTRAEVEEFDREILAAWKARHGSTSTPA